MNMIFSRINPRREEVVTPAERIETGIFVSAWRGGSGDPLLSGSSQISEGGEMRDLRVGKTYRLSWKEWVIFCAEQKIDPVENCEFGFNLGGGDSYTVACYEKPSMVKGLSEFPGANLRNWALVAWLLKDKLGKKPPEPRAKEKIRK